MECSACGAQNPEGKRFCADCGSVLVDLCPRCASVNPPGKKFCGECGTGLGGARTQPAAGSSPGTKSIGAAGRTSAPNAERRQLSVMFCDLVGSTALSGRLDPEDLQQLIRSYHDAVVAAVAPYAGHIAQFLGDGVLAYFGYPQAHEDDAARAVRAGLDIMKVLETQRFHGDIQLHARIGIATGRVVIGEIGAGTPAAERSASGETPNLAARLQALAAPGEIVLSQTTKQLLDASFELSPLGPLTLKGFDAPVYAWRVLDERSLASRFEARHDKAPSVLVGRNSELALLLERWAQACEGEGQVVVLSGEAGIGKSRIGQALRERLADEEHASVVLQCSPYFSGSALYPVVQHLRLAAGITKSDDPSQQRHKVSQLAAALQPEGQGALLRLMGLSDESLSAEEAQMPQQQKTRTLNALIDLVSNLALQQPVWLWLEDAHWIDPTTQELIAMLVDRLRDARLLTLVTTRPEFTPDLSKPAHLTTLTLNRLGQRQCAALIDAVTQGMSLPQEVQAEIIRKTDGVPLFVEELTKTVLQSGLLEQSATGYRLTGALLELAIPSTLQDSLMARLDRLNEAKEVAQAAAAIGREFSRALLTQVLQGTNATQLDKALAELEAADLLIRRGEVSSARYAFKHALVRDTAYNSMLKTQRALRHGQIAAALERTEPETAVSQPELLAYHIQEAGEVMRAAYLWAKAGEAALARAANRESAVAFESALSILERAPQTSESMEREIDIRITLGPVLFGLRGHSEAIEASYQRAQALAEKIADRRRLFQVLWGLNFTNYMAGRYAQALPPARRLLELASRDDDGGERLEAHHAMWGILMYSGRPAEAAVHLGEGRALYRAERHSYLRYQYAGHDPGVCCCAWTAVSSWLMGFPDRAQSELAAFRTRIDEVRHPSTKILLAVAGWVHCRLGEFDIASRMGAELMVVAQQHGLQAWAEPAVVLLGLAPERTATPGRLRELSERFMSGKSSKSMKLLMLSILAEICVATGDVTLADQVLSPMLASRDTMHRSELLRLDGELVLKRAVPDAIAAEQSFRSAIEVAREQGAKSFELRAATSLAALWHEQGKRLEAQELLGGVYGWFTEGFDTPDLRRAKSLLDAWASA